MFVAGNVVGTATLTIQPGIATNASAVEGVAALYIAGDAGWFHIAAVDAWGNRRTRGGDRWDVTVIPDRYAAMEVQVTDLGTGGYRVMFQTMPEPDLLYTLNVSLLTSTTVRLSYVFSAAPTECVRSVCRTFSDWSVNKGSGTQLGCLPSGAEGAARRVKEALTRLASPLSADKTAGVAGAQHR